MSYIVKQNQSGKTYLLLAANHHVPDKGARQDRIYLGTYDHEKNELVLGKKSAEPTAEALEALKNAGIMYNGRRKEAKINLTSVSDIKFKGIESVGDTHVLTKIAEQTKLLSVLNDSYGKSHATALLSLAIHQVITQQPLYLYKIWLENAPESLRPSNIDCSSPGLSKLLLDIGSATCLIDRFFTGWIDACKKPETLICDTTSLSTYSELLQDAEWGYNRDHETLPQVNVVLVIDRKRGTPLMFRQLPGSVSDIVTLENTSKYLREYGLERFTYILDRGFCSEYNLNELINRRIGFLMAASWNSTQAKELRKKHYRTLTTSPKHSILYRDQILRHIPDNWKIGSNTISSHLFFDQTRASHQCRDFEHKVLYSKNNADGMAFTTFSDAIKWLESLPKQIQSCFNIISKENSDFKIDIKTNAVAKKINEKGFTLILSSESNLDGVTVISEYRQRDKVEKLISIGKNELDQLRLRSGNDAIVKGRLFVTFLALILYSEIERRLDEAKLLKTYSVAESLAHLRNIQAINLENGKRIIREITKKQRQILEALNVGLPK